MGITGFTPAPGGGSGATEIDINTTPVVNGTDGATLVIDGAVVGETGPGTAGQVLTSNGAGAIPTYQALPGDWTYVILGSQFDTSSTSLADITGWSFTLTANMRYELKGVVLITSAANTTGAFLSWTATNAPTLRVMQVVGSGATAATSGTTTTVADDSGAAMTGSNPAGLNALSIAGTVIVAGSNSVFQMRGASEVGASQVSFLVNSWIAYRTF